MSIRRFFAKTTSEALRKVREALGSEGVILSNRAMDGGVEILALSNNDMTLLLPPSELDEAGSVSEAGKKQNAAKPGRQMRTSHVEKGGTDGKYPPRPDLFIPPEKQERWRGNGAISDHAATSDPAIELPKTSGLTSGLSGPTAPIVNVTPDSASAGKKRSSLTSSPDPEMGRRTVIKTAAADVGGTGKRKRNDRRSQVKPDTPAPGKRRPSALDFRQVADDVAASVLREIKLMHGTLEQLTTLNWNEQEHRDPIRGRLLRQLLAAGFSSSLAHDLMNELPADIDEKGAISRAKTILAGNLQTMSSERELLEKGGVYALVGPTGVGKTTTTAKLAARCVVRHGADKLALLTTDGYRIGGHEQLRIYGKILGVTVHAVRDTQDLTLALTELRGKHMVLIDTVGMGQRDQMVAEQVAMLAGCGTEVKRLLLLNAASNGHTLNEVAYAYRGDGLAGAILTKLDEAVSIGCALDTAIRHRLPLYYVAQGQRVPEDLEMADAARLISCALENTPSDSPFAMAEEAFSLVMPDGNKGARKTDMSGARLG